VVQTISLAIGLCVLFPSNRPRHSLYNPPGIRKVRDNKRPTIVRDEILKMIKEVEIQKNSKK